MASRKYLLREIRCMHAEMKVITLQAGIKEKRYQRLIEYIKQYTDEELELLLIWLRQVKKTDYSKIQYILGLVSKEMWENYKVLGVKNLTEQMLLAEGQRRLIFTWKSAYKPERCFYNETKQEIVT